MTRRAPVGSIRHTSVSGSGGAEGTEFIQYVDSREPQIHEVWDFVSDGITHEVHSTAQVDAGNLAVGEFSSDYLNESGRRILILGRISINGSVEWLGVTEFLRTNGPA